MASGRSRHSRLMSQINVVPYIDVMLVLLVIFMVTAPLLQTGVEVDLPEVEAKPLDEQQSQDQEPLVVTVDRQGQFFLGSSNALSRENLLAEIGQRLKARADAQAYVRGDQGVEYGRVVEAMVILQQAGAGKIGLITDPPPEEPAR